MSEIAKTIGRRVRNYRIEKGLSQEKLAELSGCHPTYIGQVERGEKNATLESIEKIASAMNVSLAQLFEKIGESSTDSYPMKCYELVGEYTLHIRLYEIEERLNSHQFVRISNSEIINLKRVDNFDLSFTGTICVKLSNGTTTYVSRRYVAKIKKILGI